MSPDSVQTLVNTVTQALTAAGYVSEPDPTNNISNAPAYLKVFCQGLPKSKRVDYLNLVFGDTSRDQVTIEGEDRTYDIPAAINALVERVRNNLPCSGK